MRLLKLGLALFALALGASSVANAEPVKIRLSWVAPIANIASIMLEKKDLAVHMGKSYVLEAVRYQGTPPMITAVANNELEIADFAFSSFPIAIQNAGIDDLRVISDEFQDGVQGYYSNEYYVLNDGPIKKIEDLKGKVVATNVAGSGVDIASRAMLRKHGLEDKRDYTVIEAPFPTMKALLMEKKADLIPAVLPFSLDPELNKVAHRIFDMREAVGRTQFVMFTVRKSFIDKNRAALVDMMEDTLRITRWYIDQKNHQAAIEAVNRAVKIPVERLGWIFTNKDYYRDPNLMPDLNALQRNVDLTHELGFIKAKMDVKKYSDLSIVQEAAKRIK
ncbi:MAG TPA: ABC transporter substrate-binding protein [Xanthobacteraceae bacterium]|nr:ABC transporter substrate-binding protein [Xanthobacteraceae bacterium]